MPRRTSPPVERLAPPDRALEYLAFAAGLVLVAVVPLVWSTGSLQVFRGPQSELALAAGGVLAATMAVRAGWRAAWRDPWWLAWGGVVAGSVVAALASGTAALSLGSALPIVLAGLAWGGMRALPDSRRTAVRSAILAVAVLEATLVLLFLPQAWRPAGFGMFGELEGRYNWIGTLGNPGYVAIFLTLPALLAATLAIESRRRRRLHIVVAAFLAFVAIGTLTLTAIAALALGAAIILWRRLPARRRLTAITALVVAGLVLAVATPLRVRLSEAAREIRTGGWLFAGSARGAAVAAAFSMLRARPLLGVGPGQFAADSFRYSSETALAERGHTLGIETGFGEAHNDILQYAAETGIIGLALALAGLIVALRRTPRKSGGLVPDRAPLLAAALLLTLTQFPFHLAAIAAQWVALLALAMPRFAAEEAGPPLRRWLRVAAASVLGSLGVALAWERFAADSAFREAKLLSQLTRAQGGTMRRQAAREALSNLAGRERWLPGSWDARLILGNLAVDAGRPELALRYFASALALAERPEIRFDVGMALVLTGEREAGLTHLARAVELNPVILKQIKDTGLAQELRRRLDASGYGTRHPWIYDGTAAATP